VTFRRERYPSTWPQIRLGILWRAGNRCERCLAPNHAEIQRGADDHAGLYRLDDGEVWDAATGKRWSEYLPAGAFVVDRFVRVVLTIAHLDHDEGNNVPENLRALCQLHHLAHDRLDNQRRARATRAARLAGPEATGGGRDATAEPARGAVRGAVA